VADNTPQNGSASIAADDITSMNGNTVAANSQLTQRVKVGYGDDGTFRDVSMAYPLPVIDLDVQTSGTITVLDAASTTVVSGATANVNVNRVTGTPTAGSAVTLNISGESSFSVDISGTWTGSLTFERTVDGVTWTDISLFVAGTAYPTKVVVGNGAFHGNASAASAIRVRATATMTGSAAVVIRTGGGTGTITLGSPVREPHDVGRVQVSLLIDSVAAVATEALISYSGFNGATALTAGTAAFTVPTGRAFRIQSVQLTARGTAIDTIRARVRGQATVSATSQFYVAIAAAISANGGNSADVEPSREIEIPSGQQVGLSVVGATTSTYTLAVMGYTYLP
jgi:hypothetical protein